jgi:predicted amidohydrolase YtcJ
VLIHAQLLGPDQLPRVRELGAMCSFFPAHVWYWGDEHLKNFGETRARHCSPAASALRAGVPFTFHQDSPVVQPDMLETVWCAVCRVTKAGVLLGPEERIPAAEALRAVTASAARQYFEENDKGTLAPGKRADLVILSQDPTAVPPEQIREIRVLETVRNGGTVYVRE